jgi:hypothetical protein
MDFNVSTPPTKIATSLDDSGAVACGLGVWTQLIAQTSRKSKWVQLRINNVLADGSLEIGYGAPGSEVPRLHWAFSAGTNWDVGNLAFEIPAGTRLTCRPTVNIGAVELHVYY